MPEARRFLLFTSRLNEMGMRYMVSGSVAMMMYGEPRLTNDVDVVVILEPEHIARLPEVFPASEFYCPPEEVIRVEAARDIGGHINIIHHETGFKADLFLAGSDPFNMWAFARVQRKNMEDDFMMVAPPEYVIVRKLEFFRSGGSEKHLRDIRSMLRTSPGLRDNPELGEQIDSRGLKESWKKVLEKM